MKGDAAMKIKIIIGSLILMLTAFAGNGFGWTETSFATYFGIGAGQYTTGSDNTFIGVQAGNGLEGSTGDQNTFLGHYAGHFIDTGNHNNFIGNYAGYANHGGGYNNFIGSYAGYRNHEGVANTFIGYYAGYENVDSDYNNFIGYNAGRNNNGGRYNNFIGSYAGYNNTTGQYNNIIGYWAGYNADTGNHNNIIGYYAGVKNTGGYNVYIGSWAGYDNTTGSGNVFLGHRAGAHETGSNKLYISNSDTATPLIYGDFSTGTVVIHGKITLQSSREAKDEIASLTTQEAMDALDGLRPVTFVYRADRTERHMGFIAEDLPEPVSTKDRKGVNPMDIVTVLTKVVQEQQKIVDQQQGIITSHAEKIAKLERLLAAKSN